MNAGAMGQKMLSGSLELGLYVVVKLLTWCWALNSGPLQDQHALLTSAAFS